MDVSIIMDDIIWNIPWRKNNISFLNGASRYWNPSWLSNLESSLASDEQNRSSWIIWCESTHDYQQSIGRSLPNNVEYNNSLTWEVLQTPWGHPIEIGCGIRKPRAAFARISPVLKKHHLNLNTKSKFVRCYASSRKIEALMMWVYRRVLKIPWTEYSTKYREDLKLRLLKPSRKGN